VFIDEVIEHSINRATQREHLASKTYNVHKNSRPNNLSEPIPEYIGGEKLIPDETSVLIGYYHSDEQYDWITSKKLYNFRMGTGNGSLILDKSTVAAKFLLLHGKGDQSSSELWKIVSKGPKVFAKENMLATGYVDPKSDHYLVIEIEKLDLNAFGNARWDFQGILYLLLIC